MGIHADVRPGRRQRLGEYLRAKLRKDAPPNSISPVLERLIDLLIIHLSLGAHDLLTVSRESKQDDRRQRHFPSRSPPLVPDRRRIGHRQAPLLYSRNSIPRSVQATDRQHLL